MLKGNVKVPGKAKIDKRANTCNIKGQKQKRLRLKGERFIFVTDMYLYMLYVVDSKSSLWCWQSHFVKNYFDVNKKNLQLKKLKNQKK